MHRARTAMEDERGITIIEILVATLIIGILAGIALPSFAAQKSKGEGAAAKAFARAARTAIETHYTDSQTYNVGPARLIVIEPGLQRAKNLQVSGTDDTYRISVDDLKGRTFGFERFSTGDANRFCSPAGEGACPATGLW